MDDFIIRVSGLVKRYAAVTAVDGISLDVRRGEIFGLLGPNGAGKTSTLECLEGLRQPDSGSMSIGGIDPVSSPRKLRNLIGVQLQTAGLPASITPDEAMRFFCAYHAVPPRYDLLERIGLASKRTAQFCELSTGQQRRLLLALAVAHDPRVVFLDEPTAGLDVETRAELHTLMREMRSRGTTIVLATHDMAEAEQLADRVAILLRGRIAAVGTPLEITATGAGLTRISVVTELDSLVGEGVALPAVSQRSVRDNYLILLSSDIGQTLTAIIQHIQAAGDSLIDLRVERPSLEDRFLEITSGDGVS